MNLLFLIEEYGPIMAANEDYGLLITVNAAYFNLWVDRGDDNWENTDAYAADGRIGDLYKSSTSFDSVQKAAEKLLEEITDIEEEDED